MPDVSMLATLVATVLGFVLGALWYGPLFGKAWMRALAVGADLKVGPYMQDFNPAKTYGATFVLGLIASYAFGLFVGPNPGRAFAIAAGAGAGICFVATALATNYLFEGRRVSLILINGGYHAVRFILIGLAFAFLG